MKRYEVGDIIYLYELADPVPLPDGAAVLVLEVGVAARNYRILTPHQGPHWVDSLWVKGGIRRET